MAFNTATLCIMGARLSDRDVEKLLANLQVGSLATRDEQEVAGYADVPDTIFNAYDAISPTENHIRQLHRDLLSHSSKDERHRGSYKTLANHVEAFGENGKGLSVVCETAKPRQCLCRKPYTSRYFSVTTCISA